MKLDADKKKLLFLVPFLLLIVVATLWMDGTFDGRGQAVEGKTMGSGLFVDYQDNAENVDKLSARERKKRLIQRQAQERSRSNPDDFFSKALTQSKPEAPKVDSSTLIVDEPVEKEKIEESPKVVYIERPSSRSQATQYSKPVEPEPQPAPAVVSNNSRKRAGFSSTSSRSTDGDDKTTSGDNVDIPVVIHRSVTVKAGERVKLRTIKEVNYKGIKIPAHTLVDGIVSIGQNVLNIQVQGISANGRYIKAQLEGYSPSGTKGLALAGETAGSSTAKDVSTGLIQTITSGGQGGINPINSPLNRNASEKINERNVPLTSGTKLILR